MPGIADRKNAKDNLQKLKPQDFNAKIKVRIMGGRTSTERSCLSNFTDTYTWTCRLFFSLCPERDAGLLWWMTNDSRDGPAWVPPVPTEYHYLFQRLNLMTRTITIRRQICNLGYPPVWDNSKWSKWAMPFYSHRPITAYWLVQNEFLVPGLQESAYTQVVEPFYSHTPSSKNMTII